MTLSTFGDIKLFAGSGCPELAHRIANYIGIPVSPWDIVEFPNENLLVRLLGSVRGQDVYIIQSHARPVHRNMMEMLIAIDCLKRDSAGRITAVVPYMAYSQSDKKVEPRVPITARLLAELPVVDLSVTDPPIDEVIDRVFNTGDELAEVTDAAAPEPALA